MKSTFAALHLQEPILRAIREQGYTDPTPIQSQAIPPLLEGRDLLGVAQTGTGKTAAFALPILDYLTRKPRRRQPRRPRVLVLTPTRELATQISTSFRDYGRHVDVRHATIYGGVGQGPQAKALHRGTDVVVATPGRLIDLMEQRCIDLSDIEVFVLDEADRMLDMGFIHAVREITSKLPRERQTLLFSATMPNDIADLARSALRDPLRVEAAPPATTVKRIEQFVLLVEKKDKRSLLGEVLKDPFMERVLVFTRTKHGADRVVKHLRALGQKATAIHGDKAQGARERALEGFRKGRFRILVATDIAARGIDVRDITHVINFDVPHVPENYVHRIGRTARAGRDGIAITFCDFDEREFLLGIERAIRLELPVMKDHPFRSLVPLSRSESSKKAAKKAGPRKSPGNRRKPWQAKKPWHAKKADPRKPAGQGKPTGRGKPSGPRKATGPKKPSGPKTSGPRKPTGGPNKARRNRAQRNPGPRAAFAS